MGGLNPVDVYLTSFAAAVIICAASLVIGWRYGVVKTRAELLAEGGKNGKTGSRNRTPERFRQQIQAESERTWSNPFRGLGGKKREEINVQTALFGPPQAQDVPLLTVEGDTQAEVESTLLRTLETGQVSEMEEATAHAAQFGLDKNLVKIARVLIQRLTDAYLGFDGPGALLRKAAAAREHEEAVRQRLEQLDAEQHSVRMEREQFDRDRQRFELEMSELRDKYTKERQAFEAQMALERESMMAEIARNQLSHSELLEKAKLEMDDKRLGFAEEVELWTKKRNAEITDIHRIRRELDGDAVKRASEAATFAANVTRVLSGLEMALARQDEDTGQSLEEGAWKDNLDAAIARAYDLSWSQMPEVHEMYKLAKSKHTIICSNAELRDQVRKRVVMHDPTIDTGLEMCLFKVRGMEGLEANLVNQAVGLAKLRLAINIGDPKTIKAVYKAACGDADGKEPFLLMATAVLERCAATEVLAEALESQDPATLMAAIRAGEVVLDNIEKDDAARPSSKEKKMDLLLITQVLQATGVEFGYGVEGLTKGLRDIVNQGNAVKDALIALQTYEKIPDDELVGNKGRPVIQACADHLLELTWRNDSCLKPVYTLTKARCIALEADEELKAGTDKRMMDPDVTKAMSLDVFVEKFANVEGSTPKLKRQAQLVCGLKNAMLANDVRLMGDIVRMMYLPSGQEPPLVKTAEIQCQRIKAEEELMEAMDEAADRDALHTADINTLNTCLQKAEKVLADADKMVALGAREHNVKGHLPSVVESARLMIVQLRAVHDMAQASNDVEKLQRAINAAEETETRAKQLGAKTSIRDDIAEHTAVLGTLRSKQDLQNAIASRLLPRVKAAMDIAANHNLVDALMTEAQLMLENVNAVSLVGAFAGHKLGGRRNGRTWLSNPQFKLEVEGDAPVTLSITLVEASSSQLGVFALDARRNKEREGAAGSVQELLPDSVEVAGSEYNESVSELMLRDMPIADFPIYLVPSCFNKSTEGSFTITVMAQTHGIKISCVEVNKLEDQLIHAMKSVDRDWTDDRDENAGLVEIGALMDRVDELNIESDVVEQGRRFLASLTFERQMLMLMRKVDAQRELAEDEEMTDSELMDNLARILDSVKNSAAATEINSNILGRAKQMNEQLQAEQFMRDNTEKQDIAGLEYAVQLGQDASCSSKILTKYIAKLKFFKAEAALREALAELPEFDFDVLLVAYNTAKQVGLKGEMMDQGAKLLEMPGTLKNTFEESFLGVSGPKGTDSWMDNPQYRIRLLHDKPQRIAVSFTVTDVPERDGVVPRESALHVMRMQGEVFQAGAEAFQITSTDYDLQDTKMVSFEIEPEYTYFVIPSMQDPMSRAAYTLELHQPCQRATGDLLCITSKVDLVQSQLATLLPSMKLAFGTISPTVTIARDSASKLLASAQKLGLTRHAVYERMRLRMLQLSTIINAQNLYDQEEFNKLRKAISSMRTACVPRYIVHEYEHLLWEREIDTQLSNAMSNMMTASIPPLTESFGELRALLDVCEVYDVKATDLDVALTRLEKFKHVQLAYKFSKALHNAVGRADLGQWRDNPALEIIVGGSSPETVCLSIVRDAKTEAKGKDDSIADGDRDFDKFGVHVVRNTGEWQLGGVGVEYEVVASLEYDNIAPKFLTVTLDPSLGPYFMVPSTFEEGEEGWFTVSMLAMPTAVVDMKVSVSTKALCKFKGQWSADKGGSYSRAGQNVKAKNFKVGKTWVENPQFRLYLNWDSMNNIPVKLDVGGVQRANLTVVLSTTVEGAELGLHLIRNKQCSHHNEHMEVLAQRYHMLVDHTQNYMKQAEIHHSFVLRIDEGTKDRNGALVDFPFFIVPSLYEKMGGEFFITFYSDEDIGIKMVSQIDRNESGRLAT